MLAPVITAVRTSQAERIRAMRERLLEATVDWLVERGWAGTSTTVVTQRAGVSRGAQLHHFPSKQDLVVAAVEYIAERRRGALRSTADGCPGAGAPGRCCGLLSNQFTSPGLPGGAGAVGGGADRRRRCWPKVAPFERGWAGRRTRSPSSCWRWTSRSAGDRQLVQATLDLVRGLGLATTITDDSVRRAAILDAWAETLDDRTGTMSRPSTPSCDDLAAESLAAATGGSPDLTTTAGWGTDTTPRAGPSPPGGPPALDRQVADVRDQRQGALDAHRGRRWRTPRATSTRHRRARAGAARVAADRWRGGARRPRDALRRLPDGKKMPVVRAADGAVSMATARFMETWAHGRDVADALGVDAAAHRPVRHVAHLGVRTRGFAFATRGLGAARPPSSGSSSPRRPASLDLGPEDAAETRDRLGVRLLPPGHPAASTATTSTSSPTAPTPSTGSTSRRPSPARAGAGAGPAVSGAPADRQLLRLLRRPALRDARDARGR